MPPTPPTDEDLARAAATGSAAFAQLLQRYGVRLIGFLRSVGVPEGELDDAAQEVWVKVWKALPTWRADNFQAWLFRIARNHAEDLRKARQRRRTSASAELDDVADGRPASDPDALAKLAECLQKLKEDFRHAVQRHANGFSYEEIAHAVNVPVNTVKSRINRGREALKQCLGPYAE